MSKVSTLDTLDTEAATAWAGMMDYSHSSAAWSDCHSTVALSWPEADVCGLQWLHSLRTHGGVAVTERLLGWDLLEDGKPLPLRLERREFLPDRVIEWQGVESLKLTATSCWLEQNTLGLEITVTNETAVPRELTLSFRYEGKDCGEPQSTGAAPRVAHQTGRHTRYRPGIQPLFGEPEGSWQAVIDFQPDPDAPINDYYELRGEGYAFFCISELADRAVSLAPGESSTERYALAFGHQFRATRRRFDDAMEAPDSPGFPRATRRVMAILEAAPAIDPDFADDADLEKLYQQAVFGLNGLYVPGEDGLIGTKRIPWTCKHVLAGGFFWDTAFTSAGGVFINAAAAQESIEAFCLHPNSRGALPANLTDCLVGGEGQFPILTWGAWNIFASTGDRAWLRRCLPALERHVAHWFRFFCRDSGLCYIYNSFLGNDDDARFDYCMKGLYNQPVHNIDSPDINAMLVIELEALARMHEAVGDATKADTHRRHAEQLNQQILERFYFAEEKAFLDTDADSRTIKSGVITPHMFLPLWAGSPLGSEAAREIIETHMLDPDKFYGELPFPSLPYNHPEYDPEGYWRGRIWPHMVFWMCQTLWLHGYEAESTEAARRLLRMMLKTPWICENYNSETGIGWSAETNRGWPGYNWCYATVILLMSGRHKQPPLPEVKE